MKMFIGFLVLAFALTVVPAAHAQYSNPSESTCNTTYGQSGIPKSASTIVLNVYPHYNTTGTATDIQDFKNVTVDAINQTLQKIAPGTTLVFTQTSDETNFNIKVNIDVYQAADKSYSVYIEVRGEGVGHLFRFNRSGADIGEVVANAVMELPTYFQNGWSCQQ